MLIKFQFLLVLSLFVTSCFSVAQSETARKNVSVVAKKYQHDWHDVKDATQSKPQVYGSYTAGCIDGAVQLPEIGVGFKSAMPFTNRMYGHPNLVNMILDLGKQMSREQNRTILISDLGHARGGPASIETSAHRSHQNGLDVDIWYRSVEGRNPSKDDIVAESVLNKDKDSLNRSVWNSTHALMIQKVAQYQDVERILLHPVVKKEMCQLHKGAKWLNKLRPWWGHHKHFHVRLKCPAGNVHCKSQGAVPKNTGCGEELDWWFSAEAAAMGKEKSDTKRVYPNLPKQCEDVWNWQRKLQSAEVH